MLFKRVLLITEQETNYLGGCWTQMVVQKDEEQNLKIHVEEEDIENLESLDN